MSITLLLQTYHRGYFSYLLLVLSASFFSWDCSVVLIIQKQHHLYILNTPQGAGKSWQLSYYKKQPWGMKILFFWSQHWKALRKPIRHWYIVSQFLNFELNREVWGTHRQTWRFTYTNAWKHTPQERRVDLMQITPWNSIGLSKACTSRTLDC